VREGRTRKPPSAGAWAAVATAAAQGVVVSESDGGRGFEAGGAWLVSAREGAMARLALGFIEWTAVMDRGW
jgi:hypothetical protein